MMKTEILDAQQWAKKTFGSCQLKDLRRSLRAVKAATRMAENPSASLPAQQVGWKEVVALYRLMNEADVTFEALMHPHWQQTYEQLAAHGVVLLVQDTTELDLTSHAKMTGLGQIGNEGGRGLHLQTMLAVLPQGREVLGCAQQEVFVRTPAPRGEQRYQRHKRTERETDVWMRLVERLGSPRTESTWVHVGDRTADMFAFFAACVVTHTQFLVRVG